MHCRLLLNTFLLTDTVRELLSHVPASIKSEIPSSPIHTIAAELVGEYDLTPLHLAAYSGSEDVVRVLLNSSGVDVEDKSTPSVRIKIDVTYQLQFLVSYSRLRTSSP